MPMKRRHATFFFDASAGPAVGAPKRRPRLRGGISWIAGAATALFLLFWLIDYGIGRAPTRDPAAGPFALLFALDPETLQNQLGTLAQVIVAVLGIAITVVSIVVQLAATRYTSRIADMFFRDRTNLAIMGFFVVACIDAVWVSLAVTRDWVPRATVLMTVVIVTGSLLLLVPYFAYVFDFLDPEKVILRIGQQVLDAALGERMRERPDVTLRQAISTASIEHLGDVAVNAVAQKDTVIASHAIGALRGALASYLSRKKTLPAEWFRLGHRVRSNPDFIALAPDSLAELESDRTWFEWKVLRHFRSVCAESLRQLAEMAHVVAIETRYVGEASLKAGDRAVTALALKYFNTYLRTALNARDVRASYNILHQYRQLAERLMADGLDDQVAEVGRYFTYYGQTAHVLDLGFVTETAAYDLSALCEMAFELRARCHDALLRTFLEIDKEAETSAEEKTLRGVRKAQAKLATYYLIHGSEANARLIQRDMMNEGAERLASIRAELATVKAKDFWEVTDRGVNFDYLDDARRAKLDEFFGWFSRPRG